MSSTHNKHFTKVTIAGVDHWLIVSGLADFVVADDHENEQTQYFIVNSKGRTTYVGGLIHGDEQDHQCLLHTRTKIKQEHIDLPEDDLPDEQLCRWHHANIHQILVWQYRFDAGLTP